jgi:hypothetical protein
MRGRLYSRPSCWLPLPSTKCGSRVACRALYPRTVTKEEDKRPFNQKYCKEVAPVDRGLAASIHRAAEREGVLGNPPSFSRRTLQPIVCL